MAKRLETFSFKSTGRPEVYPWDEWLDGSVWQLTQGEDWDQNVKADNMRQRASDAAKRRGLSTRGKVQDEGKALVIQAWVKDTTARAKYLADAGATETEALALSAKEATEAAKVKA